MMARPAKNEEKQPKAKVVKVVLKCTYGDKGPGDIAEIPEERAKDMVASGFAEIKG